MAITHNVSLCLADGTEVDVFDEYTIKLSMFEHGNPFTFSLWHSDDARSTWDYLLDNVKCYDPITLRIDGALQLSGTIGTVHPSADAKGARLEISGRDVIGLAQDADVSPRLSSKGSTLAEVIEEMLLPLGITVVVAASADEIRNAQLGKRRSGRTSTKSRAHRVDKYHPPIGERIWSAIEILCRRYGYLVWAAPWDVDTIAVVIDKPAYDAEPLFQFTRRSLRDNATQDSDILAGGLRVCTDGVPTETFIYGASTRGNATPSRSAAHEVNDRLDARFVRFPTRFIPRHQRTNNNLDLGHSQQQARRLINESMRGHRVYECVVQGHSQSYQGDSEIAQIYAINSMARVRDDLLKIDEAMLIDSVTFSRGARSGTTTRLTMHTKGAVRCEPETQQSTASPRGPRVPTDEDLRKYRSLEYVARNG